MYKSNATEAKRVALERLEKVPSPGTKGATLTATSRPGTALTSPLGPINTICSTRTEVHAMRPWKYTSSLGHVKSNHWGICVTSMIRHQPRTSHTWPWAWISLL